MPRGRKPKASTGSAASHAQSTLSFNSKSARVTKPSTRQDETTKKRVINHLSESAPAQIEEEVVAAQTSEQKPETRSVEVGVTPEPQPELESIHIDVATRESPSSTPAQSPRTKPKTKRTTVQAGQDAREVAAEKVTAAQLKKYWQAEEDSRLAPRVHQENLSLHEKILRHFDLSSQYGPCIGITRLQRWKRANMLGLEPPVEVLAVLLREEDKKTSQGCGTLAYIDELAGGRVILVE
ncbi:hypothetical protein A1O3_05071 [Capronia epimyces CBS 606.96]|uniref:DNA polymerase delta subunit 4 n=1 Tax=Capronia epimyces CBS 606.96 TaxID=1182542 RepID=W9YQ80_9EURO|nr:uncharacterized protein A1O3_05071 [Capronia epimyces CBS 606.96]EXJ84404.1 hypothetical protein A1O3_05071 [Capronia epimyces CBS 606.96]